MDVINGDFRHNDYSEETQRWLLKIDALRSRTKEGEQVKLEDIEKLIIRLQKKYGHTMQMISLTILDDETPWYSVSVRDKNTKAWVKTLYGLTIYELYCKVALFLFAYTRSK